MTGWKRIRMKRKKMLMKREPGSSVFVEEHGSNQGLNGRENGETNLRFPTCLSHILVLLEIS